MGNPTSARPYPTSARPLPVSARPLLFTRETPSMNTPPPKLSPGKPPKVCPPGMRSSDSGSYTPAMHSSHAGNTRKAVVAAYCSLGLGKRCLAVPPHSGKISTKHQFHFHKPPIPFPQTINPTSAKTNSISTTTNSKTKPIQKHTPNPVCSPLARDSGSDAPAMHRKE